MPLVPTLAAVTTDTVVAALVSRLSSAIPTGSFSSGGLSPFWTLTELQSYAVESCRTWAALSGYNKQRLAFSTTPVGGSVTPIQSQWVDLSSVFPSALGYNLTDYSLATVIEWHLLEPPTYPTWTGTPMFNLPDILHAIERRRNQFILESLQVLSILTPLSPGPSGRFSVTDAVLDIRRLAWQDANSLQWNALWRSNEFAAAAYSPSWDNTPGQPQAYSVSVAPDFTIQLIPAPSNSGNLHLVASCAGLAPSLSALYPGISLGVPDDWVWVVKFGVLADLLSMDGPARDPDRAMYCENRWRQGLQFARRATTVLNAQLGSGTILSGSVFGMDAWRPSWMNAPPGPPDSIGVMGLNILALSTPSDVPYGVSFDAVVNSPLPTDPNAYTVTALPVSRDALDIIVDYAEHLAAFKMAGAEFMATATAWDQMTRLAGIYNERMKAVAEPALFDLPRKQEMDVPIRIPTNA